MRTPRIKETSGGYYHVMSRVVDRRMVLDKKEKERFCKLMRRVEIFSGVRILTHAAMANHFHILCYVPAPEAVSDAEFGVRLAALYDPIVVKNHMTHLALLRENGRDELAEAFKAPFVKRMHDLSEFMKTLKQRFSQSFNARHRRKGTLWEERFKSILVQGSRGALATIAAYIDLNPVRAGIVSDPRHYRFSGYGEAVGGSSRAREGVASIMRTLGDDSTWRATHGAYRQFLYSEGVEPPVTDSAGHRRGGFSQEELQKVIDAGGKLTLPQTLRCRVRYFSDGLIIGSQAYVDDRFQHYRDRFGLKRHTGARPIRGAKLDDLFTARRLMLRPITVSSG